MMMFGSVAMGLAIHCRNPSRNSMLDTLDGLYIAVMVSVS